MKVLQVHVFYTSTLTSGENTTVETIGRYFSEFCEADIILFSMIAKSTSFGEKARWLRKQIASFYKLIGSASEYDVIFFHNQVPFIPSALLKYIAKRVKVVKVWHNVRPFCIRGSAYRSGSVCWKCTNSNLGKLHSVLKSCYRDSFGQTILANISQFGLTRILKSPNVMNVTVSEYLQARLIANGFSESRVRSIQNSIELLPIQKKTGRDFLYVGRITEEKGVRELLKAWTVYLEEFDCSARLHIVGDGPLLSSLQRDFSSNRTVFHGYLKSSQIVKLASNCKVGLIPNNWEEPFGKVALEYMNLGLQILAVKSGGLTEILKDDTNSFFINSLQPIALSKQMHEVMSLDSEINHEARKLILGKFTKDLIKGNWEKLLKDIVSEGFANE